MRKVLAYAVTATIALGLLFAVSIQVGYSHPHYGHCRMEAEGYTCDLINYTFGFGKK